jgi:hypothetical protein
MFRGFICTLNYPARNSHALYGYLCPTRLYSNFPHYLINGSIFEKKVIGNEMSVLICCKNMPGAFLTLRIIERNIIMNVYWSSRKYTLIV